jgi:glutathione peroxidase
MIMRSLIKIKWVLVILAVTTIAWACASSKTQGMSTRQQILKSVYPVLTGVTRFFGVNSRSLPAQQAVSPNVPVYDIPFELIDGTPASLAAYKGKKIVVVNTASDCGYTGQYEELQKLYADRKGEVIVVGFPANDFKQQEKGTNEEIAGFCKKNYGVEFPLATKAVVVKGKEQHPLFKWLSDPEQNGWNKEAPAWNFSKYIIDEHGKLIGYFDPGVSPLGAEFQKNLNTKPDQQ